MKKILSFILFFLFIILSSNKLFAIQTDICGIGILIYKDPWNKKTIIVKTLPNSPALEKGLLGDEIIAVDNKKTKKMSTTEIQDLIIGEEGTQVNLYVKENGVKKYYNLTRKHLIYNTSKDKNFDLHWQQVAPAMFEDATYIPPAIANKFSLTGRNQLVVPNNYWVQRKITFTQGYEACGTYPKKDQSECYMNLVNREINRTNQDIQIAQQEQIIRQQAILNLSQSMNSMNQSINNINRNNQLRNINNSIQQQNYQLQNLNNNLIRYRYRY